MARDHTMVMVFQQNNLILKIKTIMNIYCCASLTFIRDYLQSPFFCSNIRVKRTITRIMNKNKGQIISAHNLIFDESKKII